ncbi:MAG TPA: PHP domain-containing protein [Candidatus Binatia bacterium]|jgi:DNA polymerase (family 10)|nr:PHP domain-containing protein [Candidatus Binatia bacterium]
MTGPAVVEALRDMARLLALEKGNQFRARAYDRAADAIEQVAGDLPALAAAGRLRAIPGIGDSIAANIDELLGSGRLASLEGLRSRYPPGTAELSQVLSLPRIRTVYGTLGITTLETLQEACANGRLRDLPGFGVTSEQRVAKRLEALAARRPGALLPEADAEAERVLTHLRRSPAAKHVELAGDLRRRVELVEALDVVVVSTDAVAVMTSAAGLPGAVRAEQGRVVRPGLLDVTVHVAPPKRFATTWITATGSAEHVGALRARARARGLDFDDIAGDTEADVYARLGLPDVPPEMRDDPEVFANGTSLDDLVRVDDLRGAVHCHTDWSDGKDSVETMARAADALGLRYLTITDHSASAGYAGGLDVERLRRQADEIAAVQERVRVRLLRGTESDILRDGALDFPDAVLAQLDVVIASIHARHALDAAEMTARLVRAMRHPVFKIWGHALGRYVRSRPPIAVDLDAVLDAAAASRVAIEVNGDPHRLDLAPEGIRKARVRGLRFVVSSDAHSVRALGNARYGVDMARRGGLRVADVLNTMEPDAFAAAVHP